MRTRAVGVAVVAATLLPWAAAAAIDRVQKEDFPRYGIGLLNLYYNMVKGLFSYTKTVAFGLDDLPKAVATDIFQVGQEGAPGYYLTAQEKAEREKQKKEEKLLKLEQQKQKAQKPGQAASSGAGALPLTAINE